MVGLSPTQGSCTVGVGWRSENYVTFTILAPFYTVGHRQNAARTPSRGMPKDRCHMVLLRRFPPFTYSLPIFVVLSKIFSYFPFTAHIGIFSTTSLSGYFFVYFHPVILIFS